MKKIAANPDRFLSVHYLRAIAAIMVVAYHAYSRELVPISDWYLVSWLKQGVAIFFVISGFVMVESTQRSPTSPRQFLIRRIERVVPLYWIATALMLASAGSLDGDHVVRSLFFIKSVDPDDGHVVNPVLDVGWTLDFEMAFYALFAVFMYLPRTAMIVLLPALLALTSVIGTLYDLPPMIKAYASPVLVEFSAGMLIAHLSLRLPRWLLPVGFLLLATLPLITDWRILGVSIPAAMIVASARSFDGSLPSLGIPILLGDASYAIYLFHLAALNMIGNSFGAFGSSLHVLWIVAAGVLVGLLVHVQLERPMARHIRAALRRWHPSEGLPNARLS